MGDLPQVVEQAAEAGAQSAGRPAGGSFLAELTVRDFAIIDHLRIELSPGLNVLTGETGAGKSILIDALGAALGGPFDSGWLRSGVERGSAEAIFQIRTPPLVEHSDEDQSLSSMLITELSGLGCELEEGALILTRDLSSSRSVSRINGRAVPIAVVARVGDSLVDVHSQASHLSLSRRAEHRDLLDRFGRHQGLRTAMAHAARALLDVRRQLRALEEEVRQGMREAILLRHEVDEIDAAQVEEGEEEELIARRTRLRNTLKLRLAAEGAYEALQGSDETNGLLALLGEAQARLVEMRTLDPALPPTLELPGDAVDVLDELARCLRAYRDSLEEDPLALEAIETRIQLLADLKRRYGKSLEEILMYRDAAAARLDGLEHHEERMAQLRLDEARFEEEAAAAARNLSVARGNAARRLEAAVVAEIGDLGMEGSSFSVEMRTRPDTEGLPAWDVVGDPSNDAEADPSDARLGFDEAGVDQVTFLISTSPGEPLKPVEQVASGGELARLMLALKSAMVVVDQTPVLVFDELEQGVGGRMGHVIGEKLWSLAREHQVLCVTHLPQVAAYADAHYIVAKGLSGGRMVTQVQRLNADARLEELAQMLGGAGAGPSARQSAEEMLEQAKAWALGQGLSTRRHVN